MQKIHDCIEYTTKKFTWISSGTVPSAIGLALLRPDNVLVQSKAATSSGNGMYYGLLYMNVASMGASRWAIQEWIAVINANTYVDRQFVKLIAANVGSP